MAERLQVLIVEDRVADAELMARELLKAGFEVDWQRVDTERDLRLRLTPRLDLLLTDYNVPGFGALPVLSVLRESKLDVPVIVVSGSLGDEKAVEVLTSGATDYILKDRMARLGPAVRRALQERRTRLAQVKAEETLRRSEEAMRGILSTIDDIVWSVSLPEAKVLYLNPAAEKLLGRPVAAFIADPSLWMESIHPGDRVRALAAQEAALRWGTAEYEYRVQRPDGSVRQALMRCWVAYGADKEPARIEGIITDVTEKHAAAKELQRRQALLEETEALAHVGSWSLDLAADRATLSAEGCRIWGAAPDSPPQTVAWFQARVEPADWPSIEEGLQQAIVDGKDYEVVARIRRDGDVRQVRIRGRVMERDMAGKVLRLAGTMEDITDRKAAEEQQKRLRHMEELNTYKSQFLGMVAHDLNNVLSPMTINLKLAETQMAQLGGSTTALDRLKASIGRLSGFLADLLDASRLQSGHLSLDAKPFDLADLVRSLVETLRPEAEAGGIRLVLVAPGSLPLVGDQRRLEQVAINLLSNALKFTPKGGVVSVELATTADVVSLTVADTGPGIAADDLARLFQPFSRLLATPQGKHTGTGLGLYICRGIAEQHRGRIWCESQGPGKGASFRLVLPVTGLDAGPPPLPGP
jgi:PAS domain S-box-containing protein